MFMLDCDRAKHAQRSISFWLVVSAIVSLIFVPSRLQAQSNTMYYLDCSAGNDSFSGTSSDQAWKSLARAKQASLQPGDSLLLKRGCRWTGPLDLDWNGTSARPITIGTYGSGARPIIENAQYTVEIKGSYLNIQSIAVQSDVIGVDTGTRCAGQPVGWRVGFRLEDTASYNTFSDVYATGLTHGINITEGSNHNKIINSTFINNTMMFTLDANNPSNDSGAVGIVVRGDDNEIMNNTFIGHNACSYDYGFDGAAIEVYGGRRNLIHHNTAVDNNVFSELSQSRSRDNVLAYNLVHASVPEAQFLVSNGPTVGKGPVYNTQVYNNSVYLSHPSSFGINCIGTCTVDILNMRNNIIWVEGTLGFIDRAGTESNNIYWRSDGQPRIFFPNPSDISSTSRIVDPRFVKASSGVFYLQPESPAIDSAVTISGTPYNTDLDGTSLPQGPRRDLGAFEAAAAPVGSALVTDEFNRSVSNGWGNADLGGSYTISGSSSDYFITGGKGVLQVGNGRTRAAFLPNAQAQHVDLNVRIKTSLGPGDVNQYIYTSLRRQSDGSEYRGKLRLAPDGGVYLHATRVNAVGSETALGSEVRVSGLTFQANGTFRMRMEVSGSNPSTIRLKAWIDGKQEPIGWRYSASDSTAGLQQAGSVGLRAYVSSSSANPNVQMSFDSLKVIRLE
jgi:hypothetical protein